MRFSLLSKFYSSPALGLLHPSYYRRIRFNNMSTEVPESKPPITANEKVKKFQQVFHSNSTNSWDKCWEEDLTPWDLGSPTPILVHLHNSGSLPQGRALVPGCGSGYDVVVIACNERHVTGIDVSDNAIKKAMELSSGSPKAEHFTFLKTDFFTWCPDELFDIIFDYTYEEALHPVGFEATHISENDLAIAPRKGREKLGRWRRSLHHASL